MPQTVQEMIEEAREREALFKRAKKGVRKERLEKLRGIFQIPTRVAAPIRRRDIRITAAARKAVSLIAPKGSLVRAITTPKKKGKKGRGRPKGTYRTRVLPFSGKIVKVPTSIYKKMVQAEKKQYRLLQAQRQAQQRIQAEQVAMQTDARYVGDAMEDRFLEEPDEIHEMEVMRAQQQAELARLRREQPPSIEKPGIIRRALERQPTMFDESRRPIGMFQVGPIQEMRPREPRVTVMEGVKEPRVTAVSYKSNILGAPTRINAFGQSTLLGNKRRLY